MSTRSLSGRPFRNHIWRALSERLKRGGARSPERWIPSCSAATGTRAPASSAPKRRRTRAPRSMSRSRSNTRPPSCTTTKPVPTWARARRCRTSRQRPSSVAVRFRKARRAGTLWKRSRTSTVVPRGAPAAVTAPIAPPASSTDQAWSSPARRERMRARETEPIEARASPRKPSVPMWARSETSASLLVACDAKASARSSGPMPQPSSLTRTRSTPPAASSTVSSRAPASSAFSTSSFTTDAGRSTTSPAAIWFFTCSASTRIVAPPVVRVIPALRWALDDWRRGPSAARGARSRSRPAPRPT